MSVYDRKQVIGQLSIPIDKQGHIALFDIRDIVEKEIAVEKDFRDDFSETRLPRLDAARRLVKRMLDDVG
jgi:hypothetical protein